jgi:hypothetical protein
MANWVTTHTNEPTGLRLFSWEGMHVVNFFYWTTWQIMGGILKSIMQWKYVDEISFGSLMIT